MREGGREGGEGGREGRASVTLTVPSPLRTLSPKLTVHPTPPSLPPPPPSGAYLKLAHEQELPPGSTDKLLYIEGASDAAIELARGMVEAKVGGRGTSLPSLLPSLPPLFSPLPSCPPRRARHSATHICPLPPTHQF